MDRAATGLARDKGLVAMIGELVLWLLLGSLLVALVVAYIKTRRKS
jgi:hypothetical protein